jgi:hypothetical protein
MLLTFMIGTEENIMNKLFFLFIALNTMLLGCTSIDNRFLDINESHYYADWLKTIEKSHGEGIYFIFEAVDFSETGDKKPSLKRLKKLISFFKNKPNECIEHMEIIDESRNRYEGGSESIYVRCGK